MLGAGINTKSKEPTIMTLPPKPRREERGTYTVPERFSKEELDRLLVHDEMFTSAMGGVLPEQSDPTRFQQVLDIGCGPGGWLFKAAQTYPTMSRLVGVDINEKMLNYARMQVKALHLDDRMEFHQMDALCRMDFPDESFDLVNERFGTSWLRTWDWPPFLQECQRLTRPGGVIRITEFTIETESNSPALVRLGQLAIDAFYQAGHLFTAQSDGVTKELARLLYRHGLQDVQTHAYALEYRAGTREGQFFAEDWKRLFRGVEPFLRKWTRIPDNYEDIYQQMLQEMQQPDFVVVSRPLTAWGTRPQHSSPKTELRTCQ
jgi:ubiquinone/menaquinone biosynthesis C-methylase UbiE